MDGVNVNLADDLKNRSFRFGRVDGAVLGTLTLQQDGSIAGYQNKNERFWSVEDGKLSFRNDQNVVTTIFDEIRHGDDAGYELRGEFQPAGSSVWHFLTELVIVEQFSEILMRPLPNPRRNLMIVRAGAKSLHPAWMESGNRNWDLALSCYQEDAPSQGAEYVIFEKGHKWVPLYNLLTKNFQLISSYDYICLADDDLLAHTSTWNSLFEVCRRHDLSLAQPALTSDSYKTHWITAQDKEFFLRFTNFVEVMCPIFSRTALQVCLGTMGHDNKYGWGQDFIWPHLLGPSYTKIAVIDAYPIKHTRPVGHSSVIADGVAGAKQLMEQYGMVDTPRLRVLGGLFNP